MGQDKALLDYHGKPQALYLAGLLQPHCQRVFISRRRHQQPLNSPYEILFDECVEASGPAAGLLSMRRYVSKGYLLVLGCDIVGVTADHLEILCHAAEQKKWCAVFDDTPFNPMCSLWSAEALDEFTQNMHLFYGSLRIFLETYQERVHVCTEPVMAKFQDINVQPFSPQNI